MQLCMSRARGQAYYGSLPCAGRCCRECRHSSPGPHVLSLSPRVLVRRVSVGGRSDIHVSTYPRIHVSTCPRFHSVNLFHRMAPATTKTPRGTALLRCASPATCSTRNARFTSALAWSCAAAYGGRQGASRRRADRWPCVGWNRADTHITITVQCIFSVLVWRRSVFSGLCQCL